MALEQNQGIVSPTQKFHLSKKLHFKLANKMKAEVNRNQWMLFETAVDMMTHAHVSMEPLQRKRSSERLLANIHSIPEAGVTSPAIMTRKSSASMVSQTNEMTPSEPKSHKDNHGARTPSEPTITPHPQQPRSVHDDELSNCSAALAHCLFEWIDGKSDVIFSASLLVKLLPVWNANLADNETATQNALKTTDSVGVAALDISPLDSLQTQGVLLPGVLVPSLLVPESIPPEEAPLQGMAGEEGELTVEAMDYDATPNEITTELDHTFDIIAKSSKRHHAQTVKSSSQDSLQHSISGGVVSGKDIAKGMDWNSINMYKAVFAVIEAELDRYSDSVMAPYSLSSFRYMFL